MLFSVKLNNHKNKLIENACEHPLSPNKKRFNIAVISF